MDTPGREHAPKLSTCATKSRYRSSPADKHLKLILEPGVDPPPLGGDRLIAPLGVVAFRSWVTATALTFSPFVADPVIARVQEFAATICVEAFCRVVLVAEVEGETLSCSFSIPRSIEFNFTSTLGAFVLVIVIIVIAHEGSKYALTRAMLRVHFMHSLHCHIQVRILAPRGVNVRNCNRIIRGRLQSV
jgi:hypothetical protein